ncbi:MAG: flagellar hook-length control protein FliK [Colwellia sp.]|nr:flagellar hook-length control protein FliK [Colwellia sp.]
MPHVSVLPIAIPQATDAKVINQLGSESNSDADSTFSDLVEQHYLDDNSGKEAKNDGHGSNNNTSAQPNVNNKNTEGTSSSAQKTTTNNDNKVSVGDKTDVVAEENPVIEQVAVTKTENINQKNSQQDVAAQLLSFITSSDKILLESEKPGDLLTATKPLDKEQTLESLIQSNLFSEKNIDGEQAAKVLVAESAAKNNEPNSEKLTAEQLLIQLTMLKDNQKLSASDVELSEDPLKIASDKLMADNKLMTGGETLAANNKLSSISATNNQTLAESVNKVMSSELTAEELISEAEQVALEAESDGELIAAKGANDSETVDKKPADKKIGLIDKNGDRSLAQLSTLSVDKLSGEKEAGQEKSSDKNINIAINASANASSDKSIVLNENSQSGGRTINQSTASFMEQNNSADQQQKSPGGQTNAANEELSIAIDENEQNIVGAKKQAIVANTDKMNLNPVAESVLSRAIIPESEGIRASQNFEAIMSNMTSELSQSQKSSVALQNESIAIYKKDFANAVKDKVMIMINQKIQRIEIQLDPAELGSMNIRINLQNEQAVVSFIVQNQQAKEAVEENMDKLKNMLAESGVDVGDANVEQQDQQAANNEEQNAQSRNAKNGTQEDDVEQGLEINPSKLVKASSTGVDYYA